MNKKLRPKINLDPNQVCFISFGLDRTRGYGGMVDTLDLESSE